MINSKFYIDGNYLFHITKYLSSKYHKTVDWEMFISFIKTEILKTSEDNISVNDIQVDSKYFVGTPDFQNNPSRELLYSSLDHAGIIKNAFQLTTNIAGVSREKGVDVALAVDAVSDYFMAKDEDKFKYFVLFSGDADYAVLLKKLKSFGVRTIVVYMDFEVSGKVTKAGYALLQNADRRVDLEAVVKESRFEKTLDSVFKKTNVPNQTTRHRQLHSAEIPWEIIDTCMNSCRHFAMGFVKLSELDEKIHQKLQFSGDLKVILQTAYSDKLIFDNRRTGDDELRFSPAYFYSRNQSIL